MASKPGERKTQILQTLAEMLEQPHAARITTAALAVLIALRYRMLFIGIFAVWALMGEFAGERQEHAGIPELRYGEPEDDRDDPVSEALTEDEPG